MQQVFLFAEGADVPDFQSADGLPVSPLLLSVLTAKFTPSPREDFSSAFRLTAAVAKAFLEEFYSNYELSQPQARIHRRFKFFLEQLSENQGVWFVEADV